MTDISRISRDVEVGIVRAFHIIVSERSFLLIPHRNDQYTLVRFLIFEDIPDGIQAVEDEQLIGDVYEALLLALNTNNAGPARSAEEVISYWLSPTTPDNAPKLYAKDHGRSAFLVDLISQYIPDCTSSIMELGCNVGRNLNTLYHAGYTDLHGIDINNAALGIMYEDFPELAKRATVTCGTIEQTIPHLNNYDLVFTMAVLEHLALGSEWVFEHIARIASRYLITCEDEDHVSYRVFPRDYGEIFTRYGLTQVEVIKMGLEAPDPDLIGFTIRVFQKES